MGFLVDTDICSAYLKNGRRVAGRFLQHAGSLNVSVVSVAELYTWVFRSRNSAAHLRGLLNLLADLKVINVDHTIARRFGELRAQLLNQGRPIAGLDLLIAATADIHGHTVVTHNTRHFSTIPGVTTIDWKVP